MKQKLLATMLTGMLVTAPALAQQSNHVGSTVLDKNQIINMLQPKSEEMKTRGIRINQPAQAAPQPAAQPQQQQQQVYQQPAQQQQQTYEQQQTAAAQQQAYEQQQAAAQQAAAQQAAQQQAAQQQAAQQQQVAAAQPQQAAAPPPSISMEINFGYNSAQLTDQAIQQLAPLGQALQSPELAGLSFMLEGHTDASGPDDYNMALSQKRAQSVGQFLYQYYGVDPTKLNIIGRGESALLDPANPTSGANRRVSITTMTY